MSCVSSESSDVSYGTKEVVRKIKGVDMMINQEREEIRRLGPLRKDGREIVANYKNAKKIWNRSWDKSEVEKAKRFLIMQQRKEWLKKIRRELTQWGFYEKRVRKLNMSLEDDEAESEPAQKKRKIRIEEI